ncbi:MAG TPA: hypothetical protein VJA16_22475 [Thermoanaerobaculia bacterium]
MTRRRLALIVAAAANAALALAAWTRQPWANGPAEWRWQYLPAGGLDLGAPAALALLASLAALAAVAVLGILRRHGRLAAWRGAAPLAAACGAVFTFTLVAAQPGGLARVTAALVSRNSFGYVWDAALAPPTRALLADYPAAGAGLNQHSLTHPPGPLLAVRALGWLDRVLPAPMAAGTAGPIAEKGGARPGAAARGPGAVAADSGGGLPSLAAAAIEREVARAHSHGRPVPRPPPGPWAVAALAVLLPALSALAAWPLYLLARRWGLVPETALLAALLWLLAPARSLFTPSFDQALPVLLVGAAWLAASGGRARAAAAGALLFAACFVSYGCLPALPLVAVCAAAAPAAAIRQRWSALALGFTLPYVALAAAAGHNPWHAMRAALEIHERIAVAPRSYATWLLWNPYDFALLASPAVVGLAALALFRTSWPDAAAGPAAGMAARTGRVSILGRLRDGRHAALRHAGWWATWTWWGLLALVLLSGGVRGEAGRIWLPWMPFACLFAAAAVSAGGAHRAGRSLAAAEPEPQEPARQAGGWGPGLALLLATEAALTLALAASMIFVSPN